MSQSAEQKRVGDMTSSASADAISERITLLLSSKSLCMAGLFALFMHNCKGDEKQGYRNAVGESFNIMFQDRINHVMKLVPDELMNDQLGIINHATHLLKDKMNTELRLKTALKLERLLNGNGDSHLVDYARVQLIRRKLEIEFPVLRTIANSEQAQASESKVKKIDALGKEFALLLSLIALASDNQAIDMEEKYQTILRNYTQEPIALQASNDTGEGEKTEAAFQALYVQEPHIRRNFVRHCEELLTSNGTLLNADRAMIDLFAASLKCEEMVHTQLAA